MKFFNDLFELCRKLNIRKTAKKDYKDGRRKTTKLSKSGSVLNNKFAHWKSPVRIKKDEAITH